jgi:hypothetical protein
MVAHWSFCEKKDNWPAGAVANRVQPGVQPAFRAADETGLNSTVEQTGGCPMRLEMRAVDHHAIGRAALGRKVGEDAVEDAHAGPANEPVVDCLVGAIDRGCISPSQPIPDHIDYPADQTPVVHARNVTRPREKGFNALKLSLGQSELIRHRQVLLPHLNHDVTSDGI